MINITILLVIFCLGIAQWGRPRNHIVSLRNVPPYQMQKQIREMAVSYADKAREFIKRFPTNENVGDARVTVVHALSHA